MKESICALIARYTYLLQCAYDDLKDKSEDSNPQLDDMISLERVIFDLCDVLAGKEIN